MLLTGYNWPVSLVLAYRCACPIANTERKSFGKALVQGKFNKGVCYGCAYAKRWASSQPASRTYDKMNITKRNSMCPQLFVAQTMCLLCTHAEIIIYLDTTFIFCQSNRLPDFLLY
ncbi:hypothetical protein CBL_14079 [Carabus blaptoides fortunei]